MRDLPMSLLSQLSLKIGRRAIAAAASLGKFDLVSGTRISTRSDLCRIGSSYGGWIVPTGLLGADAICYCAGVGEDITFDLGVIERFGCSVYAFDPTPRAAAHVATHAALEPRFHFAPVGLWSSDEVKRFYAPANAAHVSHSVLNLQRTDRYFDAPCRRISGLMRERGHTRLDLLKLDIEGAEYAVLDSVLDDALDVGILCVEFDEVQHRLTPSILRRIARSLDRLLAHGYQIVAADDVCNYTLVKRPARELTAAT